MADDTTVRYIQVYTGNGKGKTTAALGLALRALGAGLRVHLVQFMKDYPYSELEILQQVSDRLVIERFGNDDFVLEQRQPASGEIETARKGIAQAVEIASAAETDLLILDEICVCVYFGLISPQDLDPLFERRHPSVELVLTGRYCPDEWMERADLVTEMKEMKHYYSAGVLSRKGFDS